MKKMNTLPVFEFNQMGWLSLLSTWWDMNVIIVVMCRRLINDLPHSCVGGWIGIGNDGLSCAGCVYGHYIEVRITKYTPNGCHASSWCLYRSCRLLINMPTCSWSFWLVFELWVHMAMWYVIMIWYAHVT